MSSLTVRSRYYPVSRFEVLPGERAAAADVRGEQACSGGRAQTAPRGRPVGVLEELPAVEELDSLLDRVVEKPRRDGMDRVVAAPVETHAVQEPDNVVEAVVPATNRITFVP